MKNLIEKLPPLFIPSYHRPDNLKTVNFFVGEGYPAKLIHVFLDSEADDVNEYKESCRRFGCNLHIFDMEEARTRYDYVHRPSVSRRSVGQARNMFYDFAKKEGISFYMVQDDDTNGMEIRPHGKYLRLAKFEEMVYVFVSVKEFMQRKKIGGFGLSQTGDMFSRTNNLIRKKVMNVTFVDTRFMYRGERGLQDEDTSQFAALMNEGYFTGSAASGLVLKQTPSAKAKGGLTDLYHECKLLNKALVTVIQYPSAIIAERQVMNGGRLHHRINYRYLMPKILKGDKKHDNIAWDRYPEDVPFTLEPKRRKEQKDEV